MFDPLDEVIAEYEREIAAQTEHNAMLKARATVLVNQWQRQIIPILHEMTEKIKRFGLKFDRCQPEFVANENLVTSRLSIGLAYQNPFPERPNSASLDLELTENGNVRASIAVQLPASFEPREIEMDGEFPEQEIRKVLADCVGYCLRHLPS
ncbi:MAG: hypothetical protein ACJ8AW_02680 [Rhodopila sp.]